MYSVHGLEGSDGIWNCWDICSLFGVQLGATSSVQYIADWHMSHLCFCLTFHWKRPILTRIPWIIFCAGRVPPFFTTFSNRLSWKTMAPSVVLHCCSLWDLQEPGFLSLSKIALATNSIDQGSYESCKQNLSLWWVYMIMMLQSGRIHVRDIQNYKEMLFRWSSGTCFVHLFLGRREIWDKLFRPRGNFCRVLTYAYRGQRRATSNV